MEQNKNENTPIRNNDIASKTERLLNKLIFIMGQENTKLPETFGNYLTILN